MQLRTASCEVTGDAYGLTACRQAGASFFVLLPVSGHHLTSGIVCGVPSSLESVCKALVRPVQQNRCERYYWREGVDALAQRPASAAMILSVQARHRGAHSTGVHRTMPMPRDRAGHMPLSQSFPDCSQNGAPLPLPAPTSRPVATHIIALIFVRAATSHSSRWAAGWPGGSRRGRQARWTARRRGQASSASAKCATRLQSHWRARYAARPSEYLVRNNSCFGASFRALPPHDLEDGRGLGLSRDYQPIDFLRVPSI